jgi:hypothetical protein
MKKTLVSLEQIKLYIESYPSKEVDTSAFPALNQSHGYRKYVHFKKLMDYYLFKPNTESAVNEIKEILKIHIDLENDSIRKWILKHHSLFEDKLFSFRLEYLDSGDDEDNNLHLTSLDIYVDKTAFQSIIQFWELQWLLFFGGYHLLTKNRTVPDPKDYYYVPPDPNEPLPLDQVKNILCSV